MTVSPGLTAMLVSTPLQPLNDTPRLTALDTFPLADTVEVMSPCETVVVCRVADAFDEVCSQV